MLIVLVYAVFDTNVWRNINLIDLFLLTPAHADEKLAIIIYLKSLAINIQT